MTPSNGSTGISGIVETFTIGCASTPRSKSGTIRNHSRIAPGKTTSLMGSPGFLMGSSVMSFTIGGRCADSIGDAKVPQGLITESTRITSQGGGSIISGETGSPMIDKRRIGELTGITDRATHHSRITGLWTQCRFRELQSGNLCACPPLSVFGCFPRPGIGFVEQFTFTLEAQGLIAGITSERSSAVRGDGTWGTLS